jgi:hypothetical protein
MVRLVCVCVCVCRLGNYCAFGVCVCVCVCVCRLGNYCAFGVCESETWHVHGRAFMLQTTYIDTREGC